MTQEEYHAYLGKSTKVLKYFNKKVEYNGNKYDSIAEAKYAQELDLQMYSKDVVSWERQVRFKLDVNGVHICDYILDFKVFYPDGTIKYVDVKGYRKGIAYRVFTIKKSLMMACWGINVIEA